MIGTVNTQENLIFGHIVGFCLVFNVKTTFHVSNHEDLKRLKNITDNLPGWEKNRLQTKVLYEKRELIVNFNKH